MPKTVSFPNRTQRILILLALSFAMAGHAQAQLYTVRVTSGDYDYFNAPVSVVVDKPASEVRRQILPEDAIAVQSEPAGDGKLRLTWIVTQKKGASQVYHLTPSALRGDKVREVEVKRVGPNVEVRVKGQILTRYDTATGPNKPYFYPLNTLDGKQVVRHWPVEVSPGETHDHPHHRGLWFTHSSVNGSDYWTEEKGTGKTVNVGFDRVESGNTYGSLATRTDWIAPDGKRIAEDTREVRITPVGDGYLMDFDIAVKPVGGPLVWGDNKDGLFGLRLADSMRLAGGDGKILTSAGVTGAKAWGTRADWVDYSGTVVGETVGVTIYDHPDNLRHPTTWHVRDYGLFTANPFGLHDFDPALKNNPKAGEHTTPLGATERFQYRVYVHNGGPDAAHVAEQWNDYVHPPKVELLTAGG